MGDGVTATGNIAAQGSARSRYLLWALLSLPMLGMIFALTKGSATPEKLLHPTGEFSARFMIVAMLATPLQLLFPTRAWPRWLVRHRRYFGVAAFAYALAHTLLYVYDMGTLQLILDELFALGIWTGWIAFLIFIPLAITSNNAAVRRLGPTWKLLQRGVYIAAVFTLIHWIFVHNNLGPALVHFVPLLALECFRLWHVQTNKRALQ